MRSKAVGFWIVGSIAIFFAMIFMVTAQPAELSSNPSMIVLAYTVSFILLMVGGMFWISIMHLE